MTVRGICLVASMHNHMYIFRPWLNRLQSLKNGIYTTAEADADVESIGYVL